MHSKGGFFAPKFCLLCLLAAMLHICVTSVAQGSSSRTLATGKSITWSPLWTQLNVGTLPMNIILSPGGTHVLVSHMGFDQSLTAVNASTGAFVSNFDYPDCDSCQSQASNDLCYSFAFGKNGLLYAAQGDNNNIDVLNLSPDGILAGLGSFNATQTTDFPSGLTIDTRSYLYPIRFSQLA